MRKLCETNINTKEYWNNVYLTGSYDKRPDLLKFMTAAQTTQNGSTVLDLGCGEGECLKIIHEARKKCRLAGVDIAENALEKARRELPDADLRCELVTQTTFETDSFDYITCFETVEHLDNPYDLVGEIWRLIKPNGLVMLTTPYQDRIPSKEHVWEYEYQDLYAMFVPRFKNVWVFPWASGRDVHDSVGSIVYPSGNLDTIFVLAKGVHEPT